MKKFLFFLLSYFIIVIAIAQNHNMVTYNVKIVNFSKEFNKYPGPFEFFKVKDSVKIELDSSGFLYFNRTIILPQKFIVQKILKNKAIEYFAKSDNCELMSSVSMQNYYCNQYKFVFNKDGSGKCICFFENKKKKEVFEWQSL